MKRLSLLVLILLIFLFFIPEIYIYPLFLFVIKPAGEAQIEVITAQVSNINGTHEKLEKIVEWESDGFTNAYGRKIDFSLGLRYLIYFDSGIKIRILNPLISDLSDNPQWIAFFKVGGCGELSSLFDEVARRAGVETRIVGTMGEDHAWNEVKINNEWVHVDPTIFYSEYHSDQNTNWYNEPKFYESKWFNISKVFVKDTREDITQEYTDTGALKIQLEEPTDRVIVQTMKGSQLRDVWSSEINSSVIEVELGGKAYNVTAEKDVIPSFVVMQDTKEIEIKEGSNATIQLSPGKLSFKPQLYIAIIYLFSIILIIYIFIHKKQKRSNYPNK